MAELKDLKEIFHGRFFVFLTIKEDMHGGMMETTLN